MTEQEFGPIRNEYGAWVLYTKGGTFVLHALLCLFGPSIQNIPSQGPMSDHNIIIHQTTGNMRIDSLVLQFFLDVWGPFPTETGCSTLISLAACRNSKNLSIEMLPKAWEGPGEKEDEDSSGGKNAWANILFISPQWKLSVGYSMLTARHSWSWDICHKKKKKSCLLSCQNWAWANEVCASGVPERDAWTKSNCTFLRS